MLGILCALRSDITYIVLRLDHDLVRLFMSLLQNEVGHLLDLPLTVSIQRHGALSGSLLFGASTLCFPLTLERQESGVAIGDGSGCTKIHQGARPFRPQAEELHAGSRGLAAMSLALEMIR